MRLGISQILFGTTSCLFSFIDEFNMINLGEDANITFHTGKISCAI